MNRQILSALKELPDSILPAETKSASLALYAASLAAEDEKQDGEKQAAAQLDAGAAPAKGSKRTRKSSARRASTGNDGKRPKAVHGRKSHASGVTRDAVQSVAPRDNGSADAGQCATKNAMGAEDAPQRKTATEGEHAVPLAAGHGKEKEGLGAVVSSAFAAPGAQWFGLNPQERSPMTSKSAAADVMEPRSSSLQACGTAADNAHSNWQEEAGLEFGDIFGEEGTSSENDA